MLVNFFKCIYVTGAIEFAFKNSGQANLFKISSSLILFCININSASMVKLVKSIFLLLLLWQVPSDQNSSQLGVIDFALTGGGQAW